MIVDHISNLEVYRFLPDQYFRALSVLADPEAQAKPPGRHEVDGDELFQLSQSYETQPFAEGIFEAHQKYVDIQFVVEGTEIVGYSPIHNLSAQDAYQEDGDYQLFDIPSDPIQLELKTGMFAIFLPQDGHMPGKHDSKSGQVKKLVLKVRNA